MQTQMMARMKARTNEIAGLSVNNSIIQPKQTQSYRVFIGTSKCSAICFAYEFTSCDGLDVNPHALLTQCEICG